MALSLSMRMVCFTAGCAPNQQQYLDNIVSTRRTNLSNMTVDQRTRAVKVFLRKAKSSMKDKEHQRKAGVIFYQALLEE